ncbi:hypothetical protein O181_082907 [Austropuccinia psidii MF-1]|uniref:dolichyl-phosphate beta-glucosyltransferase n=1 Tax=Austropuccinia psidii MF-1 TaxID=1389203 RepID=A0A9Q3IJM7_9BASI|nr:hypothetical protein [Austropuccinia psidii MF-1]
MISILLSLPLAYYITLEALKRLSPNPKPPTKQSLCYFSAIHSDNPSHHLPSISNSSPSVELSVVVPAFNEQDRLKSGLASALNWLESRRINSATSSSNLGTYELIIVDDGSSDKTLEIAIQLALEHAKIVNQLGQGEIRVFSLGKNRGKGGAVRHGVLHSRGEKVLFVDADGASNFLDLSKLIEKLDEIVVYENSSLKENQKEAFGIAIGSRAHLESDPSVVSRSKFRNFLMKGFHLYLIILGLKDIKDTQCGFKLMTRAAAREVISGLHVEGWIFDVELLLRAKLRKPSIPVIEVPIRWNEVGGSKLSILKDSIVMAIELFLIRINYCLGVWKISQQHDENAISNKKNH